VAAVRVSLAILISFLFASSAWAADTSDPKWSVRIERRAAGFSEQSALSFSAGKVAMTRNSDFICGKSDQALLGLFERKSDEAFNTERDRLEQHWLRLNRAGSKHVERASARPDSHSVRVYLGQFDISEQQDLAPGLIELLSKQCGQESKWTWAHVASVRRGMSRKGPGLEITEWKSGKMKATTQLSFEAGKCSSSIDALDGQSVWSCLAPAFGKVKLK